MEQKNTKDLSSEELGLMLSQSYMEARRVEANIANIIQELTERTKEKEDGEGIT